MSNYIRLEKSLFTFIIIFIPNLIRTTESNKSILLVFPWGIFEEIDYAAGLGYQVQIHSLLFNLLLHLPILFAIKQLLQYDDTEERLINLNWNVLGLILLQILVFWLYGVSLVNDWQNVSYIPISLLSGLVLIVVVNIAIFRKKSIRE